MHRCATSSSTASLMKMMLTFLSESYSGQWNRSDMTDGLLALGMVSESSQSQMQQNSHLLKRFAWQKRPFYQELFSLGPLGKHPVFPIRHSLLIFLLFLCLPLSLLMQAEEVMEHSWRNSLSEATAGQEQMQMWNAKSIGCYNQMWLDYKPSFQLTHRGESVHFSVNIYDLQNRNVNI